MIQVKTKRGIEFINVLNIVNVCQDEKANVVIYTTDRQTTITNEDFDSVISKIEKMLIRIAGGERV
jgi:hypothetical protein